MNKTMLAALTAAIVLAPPGAYADATKGEITKIDTRRNRVTVKHGPIANLDMPAMTMVFEVADPGMIDGLAVGKPITFTADRVEGKLTIVESE